MSTSGRRRDTACEAMLQRIRVALHDVPADEQSEDVVVACDYRQSRSASREEMIEQSIERLADYNVLVQRVDQSVLPQAIAAACMERGVQRLVIAQTGTIVLDGGTSQDRCALMLLPDYHLCVVFENQIVDLVPEAIAHMPDAFLAEGRPITFISGSSAISDIELNRVEGVHGPRTLQVLVVKNA